MKDEESVIQEIEEPELLAAVSDDDEWYSRYTPFRKRLMVVVVALSCFLAPMSSMAFLPAVPNIAADFHTTGRVINISNAVYCLVMACSPVLLGPWGDIYGRRFTFVVCLGAFVLVSVGTALSVNLAMFFAFRALTALVGVPFFSVGAMVIGDIYKPEERGAGMGWVLSGSQVGPALGPVLGSVIVTYTSWRVIFWVQVGLCALAFGMALVLLPETGREIEIVKVREATGKKVWWVNYNCISVILAFRNWNLVLAGIISCSLHYNMYSLLTPIRYVVDPRFNLTDPVYGGLFYLPPGFGYIVGSFFGGKYADYHVKRNIKLKGRRIPEDRLNSMKFCYGIVIPGTILVYGWCLQKEKGGMAVPIVMMFLGGFAQTICFPSVNTYCVDSMPHLKSDAVAGNYSIRFIAAAIGSATVLIQVQNIGIGWTCTISAGFLWLGNLALYGLIRYGEKLRTRGTK